MGRYTEPLKKEDVMKKVSDFLDKHVPGPGDGWAPVSKEDWNDLGTLFYEIIACKWERDCDGGLPVEFELCNRHNRYFLPFCTLPYDAINEKDHRRSRVSVLASMQRYVANALENDMDILMRHLGEKKKEPRSCEMKHQLNQDKDDICPDCGKCFNEDF